MLRPAICTKLLPTSTVAGGREDLCRVPHFPTDEVSRELLQPLFSVMVKNAWRYTSTPPSSECGA